MCGNETQSYHLRYIYITMHCISCHQNASGAGWIAR